MSGATLAMTFLRSLLFSADGGGSDTAPASDQVITTFLSNGTITFASTGGGSSTTGNWVTPTAYAPGAYTIRAHLASGTNPVGTMDTDLALSSSRQWSLTTGPGTVTCTLTMTLKDGSGNTVKTGTVSMTAQAF